jgi:hypothetical protein
MCHHDDHTKADEWDDSRVIVANVDRIKPDRERIKQASCFSNELQINIEPSAHAVHAINDPSFLSLFVVFHTPH